MPGRVQGKVALITGAARGQGRSHAIALAREGADIAAIDLGDQEVPGPRLARTATKADLDETIRLVEMEDRRAIGLVADVSDEDQVAAAVKATVAEFGRIDVAIANAAVFDAPTPFWEIPKDRWDRMLAVDLTGVWLTCKHVAPQMIAQGSGSIIIISSATQMRATPFLSSYVVCKWATRGLMIDIANELGSSGVRCNSVHPGTVDTPGLDAMVELMGTTREQALPGFSHPHILPHVLEPSDISAAVLYLASDESRYVTGLAMNVDAGFAAKS
jgi:SDR family mycofactocin-dependent oxidoreductase